MLNIDNCELWRYKSTNTFNNNYSYNLKFLSKTNFKQNINKTMYTV